MQISFDKIGLEEIDFKFKVERYQTKGVFCKISKHLVKLHCQLTGMLETNCNRCGEFVNIKIDEIVSFLISNKTYNKKEALEVVEIDGDIIDLAGLIKGELISIKAGYYQCKSCETDKNLFEKEY
ncbi:MAG: hypothetical protein DRG11_07375 [Epsilonproteobacteria bacterium]|nr:MAG: hypothetical protein DRG11_07375 [Campylobacterota bacterium]